MRLIVPPVQVELLPVAAIVARMGPDGTPYRGPLTIAPISTDQVIPTAGCYMPEDLTVLATSGGEPYTGPYIFTPTDEAQTVQIQGKTAQQDITIEAIPSNWGRIEWNGVALSVF